MNSGRGVGNVPIPAGPTRACSSTLGLGPHPAHNVMRVPSSLALEPWRGGSSRSTTRLGYAHPPRACAPVPGTTYPRQAKTTQFSRSTACLGCRPYRATPPARPRSRRLTQPDAVVERQDIRPLPGRRGFDPLPGSSAQPHRGPAARHPRAAPRPDRPGHPRRRGQGPRDPGPAATSWPARATRPSGCPARTQRAAGTAGPRTLTSPCS